MKPTHHVGPLLLLASAFAALLFTESSAAQTAAPPHAKYPALPSETPASFEPTNDGFEYIRRDVMIPMRDGVKLHTVILVPKGAKGAPILLTRTPYDATKLTTHRESSHLGSILDGYDNAVETIVEGGYIRVVQDVRGKHGSEGDYVMNRPLHGPQNPTPVDHATDTYDTIDWLVKNIPESNGRVGVLGISYDGFLPLMALVHPHPALKVSVPMNPMVDGWMGDDWFHNGAFRQQGMPYIYDQEANRKSETKWWTSHFDDYEAFLQAGSAGELGRRRGLEQVGFWRKILAHPSYDAFWRDQAVDKILAGEPLKVPVMLVHSLWDQEDIYGAIAVYKAIKPKDTGNDKVFLVMGPWHHGQEIHDGSALGADSLRQRHGAHIPPGDPAPVFGSVPEGWRAEGRRGAGHGVRDRHERVAASARLAGRLRARKRLHGPAHTALSRRRLEARALPRPRPSPATRHSTNTFPIPPSRSPSSRAPCNPRATTTARAGANGSSTDQREASSRPDVLAFTSDVLTKPVKISGQPVANLVASTSGTDSDWVVKLIDVYPDEVAGQPAMGGYQLAGLDGHLPRPLSREPGNG